MFEEELELEKKESSVIPLLLIIGLIATFLGVAGYYFIESRRVLTQDQAIRLVTATLKAQGPAAVHFHTGLVASSDERTYDPQYKLLEKAGILKLGKTQGGKTPVSLTADGEKLLAEIPDVKKVGRKGETEYTLPLANRKLVGVSKVTMDNPSHAQVEYSWKWEPNRAGEFFDAGQPLVKSFGTWERATLISKYGADFYHADARNVALKAVKMDNGWGVSTE